MAARNRPRAGPLKDDSADAHEERNMWNQIVNDLKRLKTHQMKAMEVSKMIIEMEGKMAERRLLVGISSFLLLSPWLFELLHVFLDIYKNISMYRGYAS